MTEHADPVAQNEMTGKAKMGLGDLNLLWAYQREDSWTVLLVIPEVLLAPALGWHSVLQVSALTGFVIVAVADL